MRETRSRCARGGPAMSANAQACAGWSGYAGRPDRDAPLTRRPNETLKPSPRVADPRGGRRWTDATDVATTGTETQDMHALPIGRRAFSLIELVIVVVIIGIIAAIAIPRMSRGTAGAADSALSGNLTVLRNSIDLFNTEHGGMFPTAADIVSQLTLYSNDTGGTSATKTGAFIFGPYVRAVPSLPVGARKGSAGIATADGAGIGWIYTEATGQVRANTTTEVDARGVLYSAY